MSIRSLRKQNRSEYLILEEDDKTQKENLKTKNV